MQYNMKTYILKRVVYNDDEFPIGTIVTITDDYWENGNNDKNTGFTVVEGELEGKKGCVANGLDGWLADDTKANRSLIQQCIEHMKDIKNQLKRNTELIDSIPNSALIEKV